MKHNKYWQSVDQKKSSAALNKSRMHDEFQEELPILEILNEEGGNSPTSRRDFLKLMGFSISAAALAASCEIPVNKTIPYVNKPEEITPGVANYYASTFADGQDYCSILVKTRDGRPIKIEGNSLSPITRGGTSARVQASILGLYDNTRLHGPTINAKEASWADLDTGIIGALKETVTNGKQIVILSSTILSPSTRQLIEDFKEKFGNVQWISYNSHSFSGMLTANEICFGKRSIAGYDFSKAKVIASFGADFLGTWLSPVEFTAQYIENRKFESESNRMSRHWQIESTLSLSGSNADIRIPLKPSQVNNAILNLYNILVAKSGGSSIPGVTSAPEQNKLSQLADELWDNKGESLVIAGSNDSDIQIVVNKINDLLGNYSSALDLNAPSYYKQGDDEKLIQLLDNMENGHVGMLMMHACNPAYDLPFSNRFSAACVKVDHIISFNTEENESSKLSNYLAPDHHYLESWNDSNPKGNYYSLSQPVIKNIYNTRQMQDSLLSWMNGKEREEGQSIKIDSYYHYIQQYWEENLFSLQNSYQQFQVFWDKSLHDGVFTSNAETSSASDYQTDVAIAGAKAAGRYKEKNQIEFNLYDKVAIGNGMYADNPWLQEMPDPITRATWDNYLMINPSDTEENGWEQGQIVKLTFNDISFELPILVQPGQAKNSVSIALGYGRSHCGKEKMNNIGQSAWSIIQSGNGFLQYHGAGFVIETTGKNYDLAQTQTHHILNSIDRLEDRTIIREGILPAKEELIEKIAEQRKEFAKLNAQTLYPGHADKYNHGHHWKMAVDLNSCIGCGACTIACQVENNIPVVGKTEIIRAHEMHWIRIDRYYTGEDMENPDVIFQPMMCQHCDNAPCENVCPVNATNHSSEGLNQMAYNRCIGTRYCANNCPYKVRRFNWYDYLGADSFPANIHDPFDMSNDLTRMVLNPDVTVRGRGVMEKCSMCVQRLQEGKLNAKAEGRNIRDGEIKTACMQACPSKAIVFGDYNDSESEVRKMLDTDGRTYYVIEEINTDPSIGYLAKIRNRSEDENNERRGLIS